MTRTHTSAAERGDVFVTAPSGCAWTASSGVSWIAVIAGSSGNGSGNVTYMIEANSGSPRTGTVTIAGRILTVNQGAPSPSRYDGQWAGGGRGMSSGSTPALLEFTFQVSDGALVNSNLTWRIDTAPGTPQSAFCSSTTLPGLVRIILGEFSTSYSNSTRTFGYAITGTFTSNGSVTGTVQITPLEAAQPWCLGATINWTGTRQ